MLLFRCAGLTRLLLLRTTSAIAFHVHLEAKEDKGADLLVTPCPLCHLNLDGQQPDAGRVLRKEINVPIFHLPQLLGLAFGLSLQELRLDHHVVATRSALDKIELKV